MRIVGVMCGVMLPVVSVVSAVALGQVLPPGDAGAGDAAPVISVSPPTGVYRDEPARETVISPVRANQPITTGALIGFVSSEPIFAADVFRPIDENLRRLAASSRSLAEFKQQATPLIKTSLSNLVMETLVVSSARSMLTEQDNQRIAMYLNKVRNELISQYGGSIPAVDRAMAAQGTSLNKEMSDKKRHTIVELYKGKNLGPKVIVTRQMVIDAYERDPKKWQVEAQVELYTLTLPVSRWLREPSVDGAPGPVIQKPTAEQVKLAESQALATAREVIEKLKAGADFGRLVEDYNSRDYAATRGGRTAGVKKGALVNTALETYIFSLPANTIGEPQLYRETDPTQSTVVLVKVGEKKEARVVPFSEAQAQIEKTLRDEQLKDLMDEQMAKLYRGGAVEAIDRNLGIALDAAVARYATK